MSIEDGLPQPSLYCPAGIQVCALLILKLAGVLLALDVSSDLRKVLKSWQGTFHLAAMFPLANSWESWNIKSHSD